MTVATINGRPQFFDTDELVITPTGSGRWTVKYDRATFDVIGGRKSGGAANEWFVRNETFFGPEYIPTRSFVEAIRLGIQY